MSEALRTLYGTTNESDSVPRTLVPDSELAGPVYSEDGRLVSTARVLNHIVSLDGPAPEAFRGARARS